MPWDSRLKHGRKSLTPCPVSLVAGGFISGGNIEHDCGRGLVSLPSGAHFGHHDYGRRGGDGSGHEYGGTLARSVDLAGGVQAAAPRLRLEAAALGDCLRIGWRIGRLAVDADGKQDVPEDASLAAVVCGVDVHCELPDRKMAGNPVKWPALPYSAVGGHGGGERLCGIFRRRRRIPGDVAVWYLRHSRHPRSERAEGADGGGVDRYSGADLHCGAAGGGGLLAWGGRGGGGGW